MIRPQYYDAKILNKTQVSTKVTKLVVKCVNPQILDFEPGQFVNIKCPNGKYRSYSIASDPQIKDQISLLIETAHDGLASNYVRSLILNDSVNMIGPSGRFKLKDPTTFHVVFFATGTGLAAFIPMFYKLKELNYEGKITLYYGVRTHDEILEKDLLTYFQTQLPNMEINYYLSRPSQEELPLTPPYTVGRVTLALSDQLDHSAHYYVCGHPSMVTEIVDYLINSDIPQDQINSEGFTHSG